MAHLYSLPTLPTFTFEGLAGYEFGPLDQKDLNVYFLDVKKGHDSFIVSKKIGRIYYVVSGTGYFTIAQNRYDVTAGALVEIPPRLEYSYSGTMKLLCFSKPHWFRGNDTVTKWNPDVVAEPRGAGKPSGSLLGRLAGFKIFGKSPIGAYLRLNQGLWTRLPLSWRDSRVARAYAAFLNRLARSHKNRSQALGTFFLRNRPQLALMGRLLAQRRKTRTLRVAVLGCSYGPEVYSVAWKLRSEFPDLELVLHALDISGEAVEVARRGVYSPQSSRMTGTAIFERVTAAEMEQIFDRTEDTLAVKPWLREGIHWHVGDVRDPAIVDSLGSQDMVLADNFLCHMPGEEAERCLRNASRLLDQGGYLFVSGIDLDVRARVAREMGWKPVGELMEDVHDGDPALREGWPFQYWGLEPFSKEQPDWAIRYASVFQVGETTSSDALAQQDQHETRVS